jgi:hypothetical protein
MRRQNLRSAERFQRVRRQNVRLLHDAAVGQAIKQYNYVNYRIAPMSFPASLTGWSALKRTTGRSSARGQDPHRVVGPPWADC